ncbi:MULTISPECIES: tyrosine-protein phosphatase [unclassified Sporosarcina]|uniref:tyrosine-protein phosphatase n=1 Tax=unclassified Sporosarcina TaxID=2647733 RepID=UPI00203F93EA|nr:MULTISPECIES: CpsB/CapC family capsule biosynthesis tyrosine phosphatase [unclassified Sporosarcina]GKV66234.1 tyrosine-protein phosphatase [Sporosarcina sp. NCCP-2331]GLB56270.1 tyrosine-protein phosphatase [Sporosarcina sp. NCCP-2378]
MIDIHSHLLFGVDDGPETIEGTMRMLEKAVEEGITHMVATSHVFSPQYHVPVQEVESQVRMIADILKAADINLTLSTGHEVRIHEKLVSNLLNKEILTLSGSRYLLLELPTQHVPAYTVKMIQSLLVEGIVPIIAHPERNKGIAEKPERLERLVRHGALAQVTAGSLAGHFGKSVQKLSLQLIEANLIHSYGSDVHNLETRPFLFEKGLEFISKKIGAETVNVLLENNKQIINDKLLTIYEPEIPISRKWWQLIG